MRNLKRYVVDAIIYFDGLYQGTYDVENLKEEKSIMKNNLQIIKKEEFQKFEIIQDLFEN